MGLGQKKMDVRGRKRTMAAAAAVAAAASSGHGRTGHRQERGSWLWSVRSHARKPQVSRPIDILTRHSRALDPGWMLGGMLLLLSVYVRARRTWPRKFTPNFVETKQLTHIASRRPRDAAQEAPHQRRYSRGQAPGCSAGQGCECCHFCWGSRGLGRLCWTYKETPGLGREHGKSKGDTAATHPFTTTTTTTMMQKRHSVFIWLAYGRCGQN